jgi:hypothetical protein
MRLAAALSANLPVVGLYAVAFTDECGGEKHGGPLRETSDCILLGHWIEDWGEQRW